MSEQATFNYWQRLAEVRNGADLRDAGIEQALDQMEVWYKACLKESRAFIASQESDFTGEDIRLHCRDRIGEPRHPNAWGAMINVLVRQKVIVPTGEYRKPKDRTSHARSIQVYRKA